MEKKEIKIVGLDLDGTLLTDKKELLPYTKNVEFFVGDFAHNGFGTIDFGGKSK